MKYVISIVLVLQLILIIPTLKLTECVRETDTYDRLADILKISSDFSIINAQEKDSYLKLLDYYDNELDTYLNSKNISSSLKSDIYAAKGKISEQRKRISRLNNMYFSRFNIDETEKYPSIDKSIEFISCGSYDQIIFRLDIDSETSIEAIQIKVLNKEIVIYSKFYEPNNVNSIVIPHVDKSRIEIGYIINEDNKNIYKFADYEFKEDRSN